MVATVHATWLLTNHLKSAPPHLLFDRSENLCPSSRPKCSQDAGQGSGGRPGCLQCFEAGQACTWHEQKKRGPSKGYIKALGNRLHEDEKLLLQLLNMVSDEQLGVATDALGQTQGDDNERAWTGHISVEYGGEYLLGSLLAIRGWQRSCTTASSGKWRRLSH